MNLKILGSGSKGNCYILYNNDTKIILDCGIPLKQIKQKEGYKIHEADGCFLSHEH